MEMEKRCELCSKEARIYCDSDEARLCRDCDEKVHSANFLVAKHSRCLLCHLCQSPTPWKASGTKLGPTISVCESCAENPAMKLSRRNIIIQQEEEEEEEGETDSHGDEFSSTESESDGDDEEEEEDGENQVVPWSSANCRPLTTSSSTSEQGSLSTRDGGGADVSSSALKRFRDNHRLDSEDEDGCCSSQFNSNADALTENTKASFRALKVKMARQE